ALNTADANWVKAQIELNNGGTATLGQHYWQVTGNPAYTAGGYYPWNPATPAAANKTIANIGQLKAVFSLRFESFVIDGDTDEDSLPDSWEILYFGNLNYNGTQDSDDDGLTNLREFELRSNPIQSDTDGDLMIDGLEHAAGLNITDQDQNHNGLRDDADDFDNDGISNIQEIINGTNPGGPGGPGSPPFQTLVERNREIQTYSYMDYSYPSAGRLFQNAINLESMSLVKHFSTIDSIHLGSEGRLKYSFPYHTPEPYTLDVYAGHWILAPLDDSEQPYISPDQKRYVLYDTPYSGVSTQYLGAATINDYRQALRQRFALPTINNSENFDDWNKVDGRILNNGYFWKYGNVYETILVDREFLVISDRAISEQTTVKKTLIRINEDTWGGPAGEIPVYKFLNPPTLELDFVIPTGKTQSNVVTVSSTDDLTEGDGNHHILLPVEVISRDKYLAGSFSIPTSWDSLEMEFVGPDGSLGKYGNLLGGGSTKIYDKVEDIMADSDYAAGGQADSQKVWFVRDSTDARKINYYTCFNSTGNVQIKLYLNGKPEPLGEITHALTPAQDFAAVIDYVDKWVKGTSFDFTGGVITPPLAMRAMSMNAADGGGIHNLTRAALIPFFNVVNNVEGLGSVAFGLFDGIKEGVSDDYKLLVLIKSGVLGAGGWAIQAAEEELNKWRDDPLKRAAELKKAADRLCQEWVFKPMEQVQADLSTWEGWKKRSWQTWNSVKGTTNKVWVLTKDSWGSIKTGLKDWVNDFADRMMEGAEKAHWSENVLVMDKIGGDLNEITRQASYTFGYTFGYISEQVAVGILTGGTVKIGAVMTKGGAAMATQLAARRVLPVVARLQFVKKWAASVAISIEMKVAVERGLIIAAETPLSLAVKDSAAEVIERGMKRATFERTAFSNSKVLDEVLKALYVKKLILTPGREGQFWHRFAIFFEVMNDKATAGASKGWIPAYDRTLRFDGDLLTADWSDDLLALYKAETSPAGRLNLKEALEDLSSVMDQNPGAVFPRIKIPRPSDLYDEFFCVKGSATRVGGGNTELIWTTLSENVNCL
ncbi:MAG: hypothetical protein HC845_15260, partial [Akkermansiaceae bacterium]|nr:hypothetical protein [Akkermansiaceae bacterium]